MDVQHQIATALRRDPRRVALECRGEEISCGMISRLADDLIARLQESGVPQDAPVAVVARNRPAQAAAVLGLVEAGRTVSNVYAFQSPEALAAELGRTGFAAVVAEEQDWTPPVIEELLRSGAVGVVLCWGTDTTAQLLPNMTHLGRGPFRPPLLKAGIEILSSGTTGPPKRVAIPNRVLARAVESIRGGGVDTGVSPDIVVWPISGIGGTCCLIADFAIERLIILLEKFDLDEWLAAIGRHRPRSVNVPPAVPRMMLDAAVPRSDVASLEYVYGGSAPMTPELQEEFEGAYGIKVIWAYGATEFCGTLVTWTPELHDQYSSSKRGAMGRPFAGVQLRVVDVDDGEELPRGEVGYLEALVPEVSTDWIRTTDLATIDEDDFVFHKGRGDGVILRGGFKVIPEAIDAALREHSSVLDAATVGIGDHRLGQVPAAAIELRRGEAAPTHEQLDAHVRARLNSLHVPVRYAITEVLPRTTSMKPDLRAVRSLLETRPDD
ncbi:MAG: long-chain fatty acid--CoA ligase [Myxococcales bacterium]|nr:long-chain fatty acid--CoA ligase [Myxococcales bacterium]